MSRLACVNESSLLYQNNGGSNSINSYNQNNSSLSFSPPHMRQNGPIKKDTKMQSLYGSEPSLNKTINPFEFKKVLKQIKIENKKQSEESM